MDRKNLGSFAWYYLKKEKIWWISQWWFK